MRILVVFCALAGAMFANQAAAQSFRPLPAVTTPIPLGDDNALIVDLAFAVKVGAEAPYTEIKISQNGEFSDVPSSDSFVPYFADLEARADTGQANYGTSTVGGRPAFIATYANVGYCCGVDARRANMQVVLIDRSDIAAGDFDVEVNTEGLAQDSNASDFVMDDASLGRAGVGNFPSGAEAYRAIWTVRNGVLTSGTGPTLVAPIAPVPTLSEWAMILFGLILAGGAALYIQRSQATPDQCAG